MHKAWVAIAAGALVSALLALAGPPPQSAKASSHREAPLISEDPVADNTDVYAFVSPDRPDSVTLVANYIPLEEPAGGPNFAKFGDDVLYELHVDNDGDAQEDLTYQFRFKTQIRTRTRSSTTQARSRRSRTRTGTSVRPTPSRVSTTAGRRRCSVPTCPRRR